MVHVARLLWDAPVSPIPLIRIPIPIGTGVRMQARTQSEILTSFEVSASPAYRLYLNLFFSMPKAVTDDHTAFSDSSSSSLLRILQYVFATINCILTGASTSTSSKSRNCTYST